MNTSTPLYEFVMAHLRAKAIPQRTVAAGSGVPYSTVTKIAQGSVKDPGVHTVQRLADYFAKQAPVPQQSQPEPVTPADEVQALQQQFILATKELKAMSQRLEAITARANLQAVR